MLLGPGLRIQLMVPFKGLTKSQILSTNDSFEHAMDSFSHSQITWANL